MYKGTLNAFLLAVILLCPETATGLATAEEKPENMQEFTPETISLPAPIYDSETSIEEALRRRRSVRSFEDMPLSRPEISQLLWAAQGITSPQGFRTAPSAGALYPLAVYVAAGRVDDLPAGIYHYRPHRHELVMVVRGDKRAELCDAALGQTSIGDAAAVIVIAAVYERTTVKYGDRGIQYVHMEAGHAAQNVLLQSVPLNLGTVVVGAFYDERVKKLMNMHGTEQPLYLIPVGRKK